MYSQDNPILCWNQIEQYIVHWQDLIGFVRNRTEVILLKGSGWSWLALPETIKWQALLALELAKSSLYECMEWWSYKRAQISNKNNLFMFYSFLEYFYDSAFFLIQKPKVESITEPAIPNGNSFEEPKTISTENGSMSETQDKDVILEGLGSVGIYDQWIAPSVSGQRPKPRYEVMYWELNWLVTVRQLLFFVMLNFDCF